MGKYFGTDGFRGEANVDLTVEHAFEVGRFIGWAGAWPPFSIPSIIARRSIAMASAFLTSGLSSGGRAELAR